MKYRPTNSRDYWAAFLAEHVIQEESAVMLNILLPMRYDDSDVA